jgi:hypothetical protein
MTLQMPREPVFHFNQHVGRPLSNEQRPKILKFPDRRTKRVHAFQFREELGRMRGLSPRNPDQRRKRGDAPAWADTAVRVAVSAR